PSQNVSCHIITRLRNRSTLFPYTTLFRSRDPRRRESRTGVGGGGRDVLIERVATADRRAALDDQLLRLLAGQLLDAADLERCEPDRKSTRLNSSHQIISYAVFCLNTKNCT